VFLLATYRDTDASGQPALLDALRDLEREELVERVFVPPLGRAETKELMSDVLNGERDLPDELGEFVFRRAEGNPYFVRQLVGALQEGGFNGDALDTGSIGVPETIRSLVAQRMHRLSAATREALCEAAVLGQAFFLEDLLSMTNRDEAALENGMEEARLAGLVRENGTDGYSFDHGLTQQALYESLPARARRRLHIHAGHAIAALEEQERRGRLAELAWHFLQAGESAEAARWSLEAGDEAWSISALAEAEQHFRTAVRLSATMDDVAVRAHALQGMGSVLNVLGHYEEARASLEEADSLFELADNDVGRARIAAELGGLYFMAGRPEDGVACVENALGRLRLSDESDSSHRSQAELHAVLAQLLWPSGRRTEALVSTQQAGELARKTGDRRTQGWAEMQEAFMLETLGRRHEALSRAQTALRDVESGTDDDLLWYSLSVLTHMYSIRGELPAALEMIQRSLAAADRRGDPQYRAASLGELARYRTLSGEWSQAEEALNEAASCVDADDPIIGFIEVVRGQLDLWRGDTKNLKGRLSRVVESSAATGNVDRQVSATLLLAEVEILAGRPEDAVIRLQGLANRSGFSEDEPGYGMCLALVLITLGRLDDAALIIEQLTTLAIEDALKLPLTDLSRLRALALAGHGRWDEAQTAAQESLALARAMSIPYKEGQALVVLGRTRMESRQISDGRAAFEEALTIFGRLGAAGEARQTESELRAISEPS
jgi:tetratricopeptide (TPR) repeat protein